MKIAHWAQGGMGDKGQGTGLNFAVLELVAAERNLGLDSACFDPKEKAAADGMDVHVVHSNLPDAYAGHPRKVFVAHGMPEHCITYELGGHPDMPFSATTHWLRQAEVIVTFWERQKHIWDLFLPPGRETIYVPPGIDLNRWTKEGEVFAFKANPVIFFAESWFEVKRPTEFLWGFAAAKEHPDFGEARMALFNIPDGQRSLWANMLELLGLRHWCLAFEGWIPNLERLFRNEGSLVICPALGGDSSRTCLEALACGNKVLGRSGSPHATYTCDWDWQSIAHRLIEIAQGRAPVVHQLPREAYDIGQTAQKMAEIYAEMLTRDSRKFTLRPSEKQEAASETEASSGDGLVSETPRQWVVESQSVNAAKLPERWEMEAASETASISGEGLRSDATVSSPPVCASPTRSIPVPEGPNGG